MAEEGKREVSQERTPILGREVSKPLRPEEYPTEEEIASLTGEVGVGKLESILKLGMVTSALAPIALTVACEKIPETPAVVRTPEEVGLEPTPTLEIKTPTAEPTPTEKITPTPTVTKEPTVSPTPEPTPTPTTEEVTPSPTREPTPEPQSPVEMVATGNVDIYLSPDGQKVGYFVPGQRFTPTGAEQDGWIQVKDSDGNTLWIQEGGPYGPAGEVEPPSPACEAPHFPDRTPDRITGYYNGVSGRFQIVKSPGVENVRWIDLRFIGRGVLWMRDSKIIEIDRQNQIITLEIGGSLVIQRKVTNDTEVMIQAHQVYRGMPMEQVVQLGGNICDLAIDDAVAVLYSSQEEALSPNPGLIPLDRLFIVQ